jgi:hypothetical protein
LKNAINTEDLTDDNYFKFTVSENLDFVDSLEWIGKDER